MNISGKCHATSKSPLFIIPSLSNIIPNRPVVQPPVIINHLYSKPGWWFQPLWETWKSAGIIIPNIWKNKIHVPNHQPETVVNDLLEHPLLLSVQF